MLLEIKASLTKRVMMPSIALEWLARMGHDVEAFDATGLRKATDRPLRICGMVRNEGEPGGGPFWVRQHSGEVTAQIVERRRSILQIPRKPPRFGRHTLQPCGLGVQHATLYRSSTYTTDFVDPRTSFITRSPSVD